MLRDWKVSECIFIQNWKVLECIFMQKWKVSDFLEILKSVRNGSDWKMLENAHIGQRQKLMRMEMVRN